MPPKSYRLDTVAAHLIERLEGSRRSYLDRPDELEIAARRIAGEALSEVCSEYTEIMGDDGHPERIRREMLETFLPRWLKLARLQNELEARRFDTWREGDIVFRLAAFLGPLIVALVATRALHSPLVALAYVVPFTLPFLPELRAWQAASRYQRALQAIVDDLERIQQQLDAYQPALATEESADGASATRESPRQPETH